MFPLQSPFDAIETQRRDIAARIDAFTPAQQGWKAKPGDWSALQIVEHLVLSDETVGSLDWARKKLEKSGIAPRAYPARFATICWMLRRGIRLPLPSPEFDPRGETDWPELALRWENARTQLRAHLAAPAFDAVARPFLHTVAGAMTAAQLLELAQVHTAYHARQLERQLERLAPP